MEAGRAQLGLAHSYSRAKVKFNVNRQDNMIIQVGVLDVSGFGRVCSQHSVRPSSSARTVVLETGRDVDCQGTRSSACRRLLLREGGKALLLFYMGDDILHGAQVLALVLGKQMVQLYLCKAFEDWLVGPPGSMDLPLGHVGSGPIETPKIAALRGAVDINRRAADCDVSLGNLSL